MLISGCSVMPEPITDDEQQAAISADQQTLFARNDAIEKPLTLYQAMARALKNNLDHRVKMMEKAVADGQSDIALFNMLPELAASVGYRGRDNFNASNSRSTDDGTESLRTSTSQDRSRDVYNFSFSWNLLDFGVSYFQAKQDANKVLRSEENRRKTAQNLMQDVRTAFWRMASTQLIAEEIDTIIYDARLALKDAQKIEQERLRPPLEILQYQKKLLEIIRRLENLSETLMLAKTELASLLGLRPGQAFSLQLPDNSFSQLPEIALPITQMENMALQLRPELREEIYNNRITAEETHKAILRLLPGIEFNASYNYDSNTYTLNNNWFELSGLITQNFVELLTAPARFNQIDAEEKLGDMRRLSVHMAVITQVHLSYRQYLIAQHQFNRTQELDSVNQKISQYMQVASENDAQSQMQKIRFNTDALMSKLQLFEAYADVQSAMGKIYVSMGLDPLPDWIDGYDIETLANSIEAIDKGWQQGAFPKLNLTVSGEVVEKISNEL